MLNKKYAQMTPVKLKGTLQVLDDSANQAYHLMDNLLQWTRSQLGRVKCSPEPILLSDAVNDILLFARSAVSIKNITLDVRVDTSSKILFDKVMFQTVLRNFISNAIKFTPHGGDICIVALMGADGKVNVEVHDSGVGIHSEYQSLLFNADKKFTTEGLMKEKGSGLGLLICKDFIEMNNGTIFFESKSGVGSVFGFAVSAF
jgi:signal transduction histidine kinase